MLVFKQLQMQTFNKGSDNNTVQALHHQLGPSDANSLDDLLGCGVECIDNSNDAGDDDDVTANVSTEIANYLKLKIQTNNTDILDWWHKNGEQLPTLKQMALKYHCIPATSASSERSFSSAGLTATKLRFRLTGKHVESLNVLHCNKLVL